MKKYLAALKFFDNRPLIAVGICIAISLTASTFKYWSLSILVLVLATPLYVWYIASSWIITLRVISFAVYLVLMGLLINNFANIYLEVGILNDGTKLISKLDAVYFSIVTWTTGDIKVATHARIWAAAEVFIGYIYMGILVALLTNIIGWRSPRKAFQEAQSCELCREREATVHCMRVVAGSDKRVGYNLCEICSQETDGGTIYNLPRTSERNK